MTAGSRSTYVVNPISTSSGSRPGPAPMGFSRGDVGQRAVAREALVQEADPGPGDRGAAGRVGARAAARRRRRRGRHGDSDDDLGGCRACGRGAGCVRSGLAHADRPVDVLVTEQVRAPRLARQIGAASAGDAAALPLESRRRSAPCPTSCRGARSDSGRPATAVPSIVGTACATGGSPGSITGAVAAEAAEELPISLAAVSRTRSVLPTSAGSGAYVVPVAPGTSTHGAGPHAAPTGRRARWGGAPAQHAGDGGEGLTELRRSRDRGRRDVERRRRGCRGNASGRRGGRGRRSGDVRRSLPDPEGAVHVHGLEEERVAPTAPGTSAQPPPACSAATGRRSRSARCRSTRPGLP